MLYGNLEKCLNVIVNILESMPYGPSSPERKEVLKPDHSLLFYILGLLEKPRQPNMRVCSQVNVYSDPLDTILHFTNLQRRVYTRRYSKNWDVPRKTIGRSESFDCILLLV